MHIPRSYLFVPGDRTERFAKAQDSGAGLVVIDLEDAVAPANKAAARQAIASHAAVAAARFAVRINAADTPWFEQDLALCREARVAAVMIAKAEGVDILGQVAARVPSAALLPLVETARGMERCEQIAASAGVQRLVFGSIDFQLDAGIEGEDEALLYFRSRLVLASALARVAAPVDGVCTALDDADAVRTQAQRARRLGFGAKLCVHPRQVAIVEETFAPTGAQLAWARRVLAATQAGEGGAVRVDGRMVDRPVILQAQALLAAG